MPGSTPREFSWERTTDALLAAYAHATIEFRAANYRTEVAVMSTESDHHRGARRAASSPYERPEPGRFFVTLPGTKKLQTNCWLIVGRHALVVEAFVCRRPDEAHEDVYRFLLRRNAKLYGVAYTVDEVGDIYLIGRIRRAR